MLKMAYAAEQKVNDNKLTQLGTFLVKLKANLLRGLHKRQSKRIIATNVVT